MNLLLHTFQVTKICNFYYFYTLKLIDENDMDNHVNQLQREIEKQLDDRKVRSKRFSCATASLLRSPTETTASMSAIVSHFP